MKKIMTLMLGLSLAIGATAFAFDGTSTTDTKMTKKSKSKKSKASKTTSTSSVR